MHTHTHYTTPHHTSLWRLNLGSTLIWFGEGNGTPLQYSCLENPMDGGARWAAVHGVAKSRTWLNNFAFTFHFHALEKEMATHSSVLAWRIPGTGEPGGLLSMGSHRVGHDWSDLAAAAGSTSEVPVLQDMWCTDIQIYISFFRKSIFSPRTIRNNLSIILKLYSSEYCPS